MNSLMIYIFFIYCSDDEIKREHWTCHVARIGHGIIVCRVLFGDRKGERPLGRSTITRVGNIKRDFSEVELGLVVG